MDEKVGYVLMYFLRSGEKRLLVILPEIYGLNQHMLEVCRQYANQSWDVFGFSWYKEIPFFLQKEEEQAYQRFMSIGFEQATSQVAEVLQNQRPIYQHIVVMGFSVGATVAWLLAGYTGLCDGSVGYYGSRIRHYTNIIPKVPVLLLYGQSEPAFDLSALLQTLARTPEVILKQYPALHGFSNPYSSHYQPVAASLADEDVQQFLDNLTR
ncbi:dienelactone hydrolase [Brevibacillus laterosporus]|uniref:dienelactone hydrolase family protein n=1 Tax=Brevibacillus laterosporus TaxID=1465 RepID=UPI00240626F5|nr:dienelactone hydrolase family protein [Brevibacillus laterosporus]MDF9412748.1 dienelactone hydrolase [Brevibacillus laterosporus]